MNSASVLPKVLVADHRVVAQHVIRGCDGSPASRGDKRSNMSLFSATQSPMYAGSSAAREVLAEVLGHRRVFCELRATAR